MIAVSRCPCHLSRMQLDLILLFGWNRKEKSQYKPDLIKPEKPESDMSSESGILADHLNEDNSNYLNDDNFNDHVIDDDPKQNSSSPELLLEAIRRIGRDKLRNIMLDLSFGSNLFVFGFKMTLFWLEMTAKWPNLDILTQEKRAIIRVRCDLSARNFRSITKRVHFEYCTRKINSKNWPKSTWKKF